MKVIGYILGGIVIFIIGFFLFVRIYVGGVNFPVGDYTFDPNAMEGRIQVPEGFSLGLYAADVANARILRFTEGGDLLVSNPSLDKIVLLERDADGDGRADGQRLLMDGLNGPNGIDFHDGYLYVAETDAIGRVPFDHDKGELTGDYERIVTGLPPGENHWKKTLRFGPDGLMYVTMGSSCNVCLEEDQRRAAMVTYNPDGTNEKIFAEGLRNSAGFDWSPVDGEIYATDNGRDLLGDDYPPCELNKVVEGGHYGWPFANGAGDPDPDFGEDYPEMVEKAIPMVHGFQPHNAPLGIEFVRNANFPAEYKGAAIVALHGSWNRTDKDGYKVVSLHWQADGSIEERDLVSGFELDEDVIGRPAEVTEGPDGAFYISDDYAGVVYRLAYGEAQSLDMPEVVTVVYDPAESLASYSTEEKAALVAEGDLLYRQHVCQTCHVKGGLAMKPLEGLGSRYDVPTLVQFLTKPTPPMPVFPLSEEEKEALAVYLIETY